MTNDFTAKKAAMVLIQHWITSDMSPNPAHQTREEMKDVLAGRWNITAKRHEAIVGHVNNILVPLKSRVDRYVGAVKA